MRIAIDASNLLDGGGVTHLKEFLNAVQPDEMGVKKITIWSSKNLNKKLPNEKWIEFKNPEILEKSLWHRLYWQINILHKEMKDCDILFVPGGLYLGRFRPFVTMCRNMLPFEPREMLRYGLSKTLIRLILLRFAQRKTFNRSQGLIFLSEYAKNIVIKKCNSFAGKLKIIPHGVNNIFKRTPMSNQYKDNASCRLLYVSNIDVYKHQWLLIQAVANIAKKYPVKLQLIGAVVNKRAGRKFYKSLRLHDPEKKVIEYLGAIPHDKISEYYKSADAFIFASTCENLPNIVLEAIAAGLPVLLSNKEPMKSIAAPSAIYFDPLNVSSIEEKISLYLSGKSQLSSSQLPLNPLVRTWNACASETCALLKSVVNAKKSIKKHNLCKKI